MHVQTTYNYSFGFIIGGPSYPGDLAGWLLHALTPKWDKKNLLCTSPPTQSGFVNINWVCTNEVSQIECHHHKPYTLILGNQCYLLWYYYQQTFPDLILVRRSLCIYCNILCTSKLKWNAPILSLQFDWKLNYCRDFRWIQLIQTVCKKHFHKWKHAQIKIESPTKQLNIKYVYTILISFAIVTRNIQEGQLEHAQYCTRPSGCLDKPARLCYNYAIYTYRKQIYFFH